MWQHFRYWRASRELAKQKARLAALNQHNDRGYYTSVGFFTVGWATVELGLDFANAVTMLHAGGSEIQADLPVSLRPKLRFFRLAHSRLPALAEFSVEGGLLAQRVGDLIETRHDMIHGFAQSALDPGDRKVLRLRYEGPTLTKETRDYSLLEVGEAAVAATTLGREIISHATALSARFPANDLD
jgi:hypothetical protein